MPCQVILPHGTILHLAKHIELVETTLLFPAQKPAETIVPLSILDATVTHYAPCAAVWFFDAPVDKGAEPSPNWSNLQTSLRNTLSAFPHLAGELSIVNHDPTGDHTQRFGRLQVTYGASTDPGVEFSTARCPLTLNDIVPTPARHQLPESKAWNLSCPVPTFFADALKLPFIIPGPQKRAPPVLIRVTEFACGGITIGVLIAHCLADAQTLSVFMHRWSGEHALLSASSSVSASLPHTGLSDNVKQQEQQEPLFNPQLLDHRAAGNINAPSPDESILARSRSLPSARYDWFYPAPDGNPDRRLPPGLTREMVQSPGDPMPKGDWDHTLPKAHVKLYFSAERIQRVWEDAQVQSGKGVVSRHDAILAHVWGAINRARGLGADKREVALHVIFGLRRRLGLPETFLGSPILSASVRMSGEDASGSGSDVTSNYPVTGPVAAKIHDTLALYDSDAVKARLHDLCFECAPQRFWEGYLGPRHVIFSSWAHLDMYGVDFGGKEKARHVEVCMPEQDGMVSLIEGRPRAKKQGEKRHWCEDGIVIGVSLAADAVEKLKVDPALWS
ncbi:transferase family-domain-containing protein [Aspergillus granulosus]|uniref:Transferase family-domain-containing protein n=1 Tax=Aspergillus granulosus TaxID=176169 RepID=A0ABR4HW17_9EURO